MKPIPETFVVYKVTNDQDGTSSVGYKFVGDDGEQYGDFLTQRIDDPVPMSLLALFQTFGRRLLQYATEAP